MIARPGFTGGIVIRWAFVAPIMGAMAPRSSPLIPYFVEVMPEAPLTFVSMPMPAHIAPLNRMACFSIGIRRFIARALGIWPHGSDIDDKVALIVYGDTVFLENSPYERRTVFITENRFFFT